MKFNYQGVDFCRFRAYILRGIFLPLKNKRKGGGKMLKTELEIVTIGMPDIAALSENEQRIFFETIFERVLELAKERKK